MRLGVPQAVPGADVSKQSPTAAGRGVAALAGQQMPLQSAEARLVQVPTGTAVSFRQQSKVGAAVAQENTEPGMGPSSAAAQDAVSADMSSSTLQQDVQRCVDRAVAAVREDVRNLHIELLRQTHMQQVRQLGNSGCLWCVVLTVASSKLCDRSFLADADVACRWSCSRCWTRCLPTRTSCRLRWLL